MLENLPRRESPQQFLVDDLIAKFDVPHSQFAGQCLQDLIFGGQTHFHDGQIQPTTIASLLGQLHLVAIDDSLREEDFADFHVLLLPGAIR